jgi:predicted ribosomally synthesized peptide with SipW-like signal peptide
MRFQKKFQKPNGGKKMKSRMLVSLLVIALAAAVIGGATMAWFTDEAEVSDVTFTAGTVDIEVTNDPTSFENVNPGDCYDISATIKNEGSKAVVLKLDDITGVFKYATQAGAIPGGVPDMSLIDITVIGENASDWVIVFKGEEGADVHDLSNYVIYYNGAPIENDGTVTLVLKVCFDGPGMDNDYQGATLELNGTFYAIQASNFAPYHEWGTDLYGVPTN